jgi:outer membrane receptor protein involved in Fe transport
MFHRSALTLLSALTLGSSAIWAQTKPGGADAPVKNEEDDTLVVLSPFVVTAEEDANNYKANSTLAGSRVRTELLRDTGATNNQSLLQYTTNTEVAGIYGNMAGIGSTYMGGATESAANLLRPSTNTRVRGLDSADNTRDYFQTDIPWDGFNVGRVDLQRGPNSILFGIGSPAGIINASTNTAGFKTEGKVENRLGSFGSTRSSFDYNYVFVPDQLSVRIASLYDDEQYRQKPAYDLDRRLFAAIRWDPKLIKDGHTTIRASYEYGDVKANRPRTLPPIDRITPYFDSETGFNKQLQDATYTTQMGIQPFSSSTPYPGTKANFWFGGSFVGSGGNPTFTYENASSTPTSVHAAGPTTYFAIGKDGKRSGSVGGFPYSQSVGIAGYATYAYNLAVYGLGDGDKIKSHGATAEQVASVAGAKEGFFKDKSIIDTGIYDFYNNLLDGNTKKEWQGWKAYNASVEQTFFNDRLGFQVVYDRQVYHDGSESDLGYSTYLSVDINKYTYQYPEAYSADNGYTGTVSATKNPNGGRVYTGGTPSGSSRSTDRENVRATAFGELRAKDFLGDTLLAKIIGHHTITGVYSDETYYVEDRSYIRYAVTDSWNDLLGQGPNYGGTAGGLSSGIRTINSLYYLTGSVAGYNNAEIGISPIKSDSSPSGSYSAQYYDSHWKWSLDPTASDYVDPKAAWNNPTHRPDNTDGDTQSSNPDNYVGWKETTVTVQNADKGDIDSLYTSASKNQRKIKSQGFTWQAYLWEDTLVGTFGWRHDEQRVRANSATVDNTTGIADMNYQLNPLDPETGVSKGNSKSWGLVLHTPKKFREMLPWKSDISLAFSNGNNTRVENRYGFSAQKLANAAGATKDYSLVINTLNDRLMFRATYYDTKVTDANLSSVTTATSTLGANTSELVNDEVWGTTSALMDKAGMEGKYDATWYWNWASNKHGGNAYDDPNSDLFKNDPETIKEKAAVQSWFDQMQPQSWFDAFGYKIDVAKVKAGDYMHAINNGIWVPANYVASPSIGSGGGTVNGQNPTGTVNYESKGWEFELTGQVTKNWNVSLNASKQSAQQTALGTDLVTTLEALYKKYQSPAGDLRRWWAGDEAIRNIFNRDLWAPYKFQKDTNGKLVSEMAPWRFNLVTNYKFDRALLKGFNVGGGYRWEDHKILGYALNATQDNLDVNKPYWSKPDKSFDLWAGYERKISPKLGWRLQLNLQNVGEKPHVTPISVEPDGTNAQYRIEEGMTWSITNTFSF